MKYNKTISEIPPIEQMDISEVLQYIVENGVGKPTQNPIQSHGRWTPNELAEAIELADRSGKSIDVRTIQNWLHPSNQKGIGPTNIIRLSNVLGRGDPTITRLWRTKLHVANAALKKQPKRSPSTTGFVGKVATVTDAILGSAYPANLITIVWSLYFALGLAVCFYHAHTVTYSPSEGVIKQVGFLWAAHWVILPNIVVPLLISTLGTLIHGWKAQMRPLLHLDTRLERRSWSETVEHHGISFVIIGTICFSFVFCYQWLGAASRYIWTGQIGHYAADWAVLSSIRPDLITPEVSTFLSMAAYFYTGIYIFILLGGLLFSHIIAGDFSNITRDFKHMVDQEKQNAALNAGFSLCKSFLRFGLLGLWLAILNRIHFKYITSTSPDVLSWLKNDAVSVFSYQGASFDGVQYIHLNFYTTFIMVMVITFFTAAAIASTMKSMVTIIEKQASGSDLQKHKKNLVYILVLYSGSFLTVAASMFIIGEFTGFSLYLVGAATITCFCFVNFRYPLYANLSEKA